VKALAAESVPAVERAPVAALAAVPRRTRGPELEWAPALGLAAVPPHIRAPE